jgi:hypothetical protein
MTMKGQLKQLVVIAVVLLLVVAGCSPSAAALPPTQPPPTPMPPTPAPPTAIPPSAPVASAAERLNAGDLDGSLAFWTDDATFLVVGLPTGSETYKGKEEIRAVFKENIDSHFKEQVEVLKVEGNTVTTQTTSWHDFTRQLGVAPLVATEVYIVKNGKIASLTWTISPESLVKLQAALAKAQAESATATPAATRSASEMTVTFVGSQCTFDGPTQVRAGRITVNWDTDKSHDTFGLAILTLNKGKTMADLAAWPSTDQPPWTTLVSFRDTGPGSRSKEDIDVSEGPIYLVCFTASPEKKMGVLGPIEVGK